MNEKWLVTGGAGFLGSHLLSVLENESDKVSSVIVLDDLSWGKEENLRNRRGEFRLEKTDIRDFASVKKVFEFARPEVVVHLAALHFIPAAIANPETAISINVSGTQNVMRAAANAGCKSFFFASTGDVYEPSERPHKESDKLSPFNIYGLSKKMGEELLGLHKYFSNSIVGRLFNLYGTGETNPHIVPEILNQLKQNPNGVLRLGNLKPKRDMVPVSDAAKAIFSLVSAVKGNATVNIASGTAVSMEEVISVMGKVRGQPLKVEIDSARIRKTERAHLQADVSLLKSLIGWTPGADLENQVRKLMTSEGII